MSDKAVTVIIPTRNRGHFLPDVVAALSAQTHPDLRVVLVDDGSTDDTAGVLERAVGTDERFDLVRTENRGPAAARNVGLRSVDTEWVAFTDDDCIPQPTWLASLVGRAMRDGADVVQGATVPNPRDLDGTVPWFCRTMNITRWTGRFQTCNLLVRSSLLRQIGGFDEGFPTPVGEDTDLGLRLLRAGAQPGFAPDAVVHHRVLPMSYVEFLRRRYQWAQVVRLVAVNPDARSVFPYPYVAYRDHLAFWAAAPPVLWALRQRNWSLPLAAALAYGVVRGRRSAWKGRTPVVRTAWATTELAGVGASCVGFLVESVRHRRLLL